MSASPETLTEAPTPDTLIFTDAAARKVGDLIRAESNPKLMLRVYVQGGGAPGLVTVSSSTRNLQDGDLCVENQGVRLLVDPMSVQYLMGAPKSTTAKGWTGRSS